MGSDTAALTAALFSGASQSSLEGTAVVLLPLLADGRCHGVIVLLLPPGHNHSLVAPSISDAAQLLTATLQHIFTAQLLLFQAETSNALAQCSSVTEAASLVCSSVSAAFSHEFDASVALAQAYFVDGSRLLCIDPSCASKPLLSAFPLHSGFDSPIPQSVVASVALTGSAVNVGNILDALHYSDSVDGHPQTTDWPIVAGLCVPVAIGESFVVAVIKCLRSTPFTTLEQAVLTGIANAMAPTLEHCVVAATLINSRRCVAAMMLCAKVRILPRLLSLFGCGTRSC